MVCHTVSGTEYCSHVQSHGHAVAMDCMIYSCEPHCMGTKAYSYTPAGSRTKAYSYNYTLPG